MAKQHWKGSVLLAPVPPVLVSCGTMEHPNILTIAWTGVLNTHPPMVSISVRPTRYSYPILMEQREFVINLQCVEKQISAAAEAEKILINFKPVTLPLSQHKPFLLR